MKKQLLLILVLLPLFSFSQKKGELIEILTSSQCGMCKDRIEKTLAFEKGVYSSELNLETKKVTVRYNPAKTNPDKIRLAISKVGHDADDIKADPIAYEKLPACCKKPGDPAHCPHDHDHNHEQHQ